MNLGRAIWFSRLSLKWISFDFSFRAESSSLNHELDSVIVVVDILLIGFNRPWATARLVDSVTRIRGARFFIAVDGPRQDSPDDRQLVSETLDAFGQLPASRVDATRVLETNGGCGRAVSGAIDWFFEQSDEGIILEDDCIPTTHFIDFAEEALNRFRTDSRIGVVSGVTYVPARFLPRASPCYLSRYPQLWGWATWKRSWNGYRLLADPKKLHARSKESLRELGRLERRDWQRMVAGASEPPHHTWDFQFVWHLWGQGQLSLNPTTPLVTNIGQTQGTHAGGTPAPWYRDPEGDELQRFTRQVQDRGLMDARRCLSADAWWSREVISPPLTRRLSRRLSQLGDRKRHLPSSPLERA